MSSQEHRLYCTWTVWAIRAEEEFILDDVVEISTVEEFWRFHKSLPSIKTIQQRAMIAYFKKGVTPAYERCNKLRYILRTERNPFDDDSGPKEWEQILMKLVGGELELGVPDMKNKILGLFASFDPQAGRCWKLWLSGSINEQTKRILEEKIGEPLTLEKFRR